MGAGPPPPASVDNRTAHREPARSLRSLRSLGSPDPTRVLDPLVVALVALVVYALHGYDGVLTRDLGIFVYGGEQVTHGVPPYVGVFNSVGPLADALPGLAIAVGHVVGADPVLAARVGFTAISAGCCALVSVLARDVLRSRAAAFVAPAVFLPFGSFLRLASDGPRDKTAMVLFLLAALVLLGRRRWFGAGLATALATLTWQPSFVVAAAAAGAALLGSRSGRLRGLAAFLAGGAAPTAAAVAFYAAVGDLRVALDGFVTVNAEYTHQPSLLGDFSTVGPVLWQGYHAGLVVLVAGLAALLALASRAVPGAVRRDPRAVALVSLGAGALAGTTWTLLVVNGAPDLYELLPLGALGVAGLVVLGARRLRPPLGRILVATVAAIALVVALVVSVVTRDQLLVRQRADVAAVLAAGPPHATVLSVNAPEVLALAQLRNPSRYQVFDHRMRTYLDHTRPGGMPAYVAFVARTRATFVVVESNRRQSWLEPLLARDYVLVGDAPEWSWYVLRLVGPATIAAVRAAHVAAMAIREPVGGRSR